LTFILKVVLKLMNVHIILVAIWVALVGPEIIAVFL
jgi:hypothetical protein